MSLNITEEAKTMAAPVVGVSARFNRGSLYFIARWYCDKKLKGASFSVKKLGLEGAFKGACERRLLEAEKLSEAGHPIPVQEKHGEVKTPLYQCWCNMRRRCSDDSGKDSKNYFERGIKVCSEWDRSYITFRNWARSSGYSEGLTIERADVDGNYEPSNCTWISLSDQAKNQHKRRDNRSGVTGVAFDEGRWGLGRWRAYWQTENKQRRSKSFSINKYGKEEAFELACEHREEQIQKLKNLGVYYGAEHGK